MESQLIPWPEQPARHIEYKVGRSNHRYYRTPVGDLPGVTTVLKSWGKGEGLLHWAVDQERTAIFDACMRMWSKGHESPEAFVRSVELSMGAMRAHEKAKNKAGDIGSAVHDAIRWYVRQKLGAVEAMPTLTQEGQRSFMAFQEWWHNNDVQPVVAEHWTYHPQWRVAGQLDLIADVNKVRMVTDFKTGSGIYDEHHEQVAAYVGMARQHVEGIEGALLVRLPKTEAFVPERDIVTMGKRYDAPERSYEDLVRGFLGVRENFRVMVEHPAAQATQETELAL